MPVCLIGTIAKKNNHKDLLTAIGLMIYEFEDIYRKKYIENIPDHIDRDKVSGLPSQDDLMNCVFNFRDKIVERRFKRLPSLGPTSEFLISQIIEIIDIDWFLYDVWSVLPSDSAVNEIIEKDTKQCLVQIFASTLRLVALTKK